jgi:sugar phosphate permease
MASELADDPVARALFPVRRSGWAIAAGYLGLFSLLFAPAPLAVVVSLVAIWHLRRNPDKHGMGRAVFGLVMGLLGSAALVFFLLA